MANPEFHPGFYETAAQVIPVLLLVMSVGEYRMRKERREPLWVLYGVFGLLLLVIAGEVAALTALSEEEGSRNLDFLIASSIGLGLSYIVFRFGQEILREGRTEHPDAKLGPLGFLTFAGAGAVMLVALLLIGPYR